MFFIVICLKISSKKEGENHVFGTASFFQRGRGGATKLEVGECGELKPMTNQWWARDDGALATPVWLSSTIRSGCLVEFGRLDGNLEESNSQRGPISPILFMISLK